MQNVPWNKGRLTGQKRPLKPKDVWAIRVRLKLEHRARDLALFNLAIDSKLRGCDLVRLQVDDVYADGRVRDRATIVQKKTGRPVQFEITEQTRASIRDWLPEVDAENGRFLFRAGSARCRICRHANMRGSSMPGSRAPGLSDASSAYRKRSHQRPPRSTRRRATCEPFQLLFGHTKLESTVRYLGIEVDDALSISEQVEL